MDFHDVRFHISFRALVKSEVLEFIEAMVYLFHDIQKHKLGMTLLELCIMISKTCINILCVICSVRILSVLFCF